ncbi:MAG: hypothetical protein V3U20_03840 [Thermoplasmata archaeon]
MGKLPPFGWVEGVWTVDKELGQVDIPEQGNRIGSLKRWDKAINVINNQFYNDNAQLYDQKF